MKSGTRREEEDQRERGLIPGGMGCFLEEMGPASTGDEASSNAPNPVESREAPPTSSFPGFSEPP